MADERLLITIEGKDGVSKTFVAVGKSAEAAGKSVEASGKTGGKAMNELAQETEKAGASAEDMGRKYAAVGATIGTALGVISKLGASYRDQRLDLQSLEDQYGTSADAVIDFTEAIQDSFNQSNDAARDSALTFATLYRNYEMGEQQIIGLMERTADISAARGRNMTEVSQMVQNALRGEAEYIEQIGVTLNDTYVASEYAARGLGNWNTLTDEAAKAQFRYVLLMEQTADTQGRAAEEADRAGGLMRRFINETQDAGQVVGGMLGPLGEMGAEFSQIAIGLPIMAAGLGNVVGKIQGSARAMSLLSLATGPVGIAITGAAVGVGLLTSAFVKHQQESAEAAQIITTLKDAYLDLKVAADEAGRVGDVSAQSRIDQLRFQVESARAEGDAIVQEAANNNMRIDLYRELQDAQTRSREEADAVAAAQRTLSDAMTDQSINAQALAADLDTWYWQMMRGEITLDEYDERVVNASQNLDQYRLSVDEATAAQQLLNAALADGAVSAQDMGLMARVLVLGIDEITEASQRETRVAGESNRERRKTLELWEHELSYVGKMGFASRQYMGLQLDLNSATEESNRGYRMTTDLLREQASATQLLGMDTNDWVAATLEAAEAQEELRQTLLGTAGAIGAMSLDETSTAIEEYNEHLEETRELIAGVLEVAGDSDFLSQWNMTSAASEASLLAENINDVGAALDNTYRVIVGNTNAIGSQMQGIKDWSDELIGDPGVWAEIDALHNEGRISLEKYNDAQQAQVEITNSNATVQRDLLAIQAAQAPMLADNSAHMAAYVEEIRKMNDGFDDAEDGALRQVEALGWMDDATVNTAMNIATFAEQMEGLEGGEDAFRGMIDGAVALNPALLPILETMGYIENLRQNSDGTWEYDVSINGGDEAMSEIQMLNQSIVDLVDTLDDGKLNGSYTMTISADTADAEDGITRTVRAAQDFDGTTSTGILNADGSPALSQIGIVDESLGALDAQSATVDVYANDQASGVLANIAANWGGVIATSWIDVVTRNIPGNAAGGVIGYASGGTIPVELAEAGSEVIHFASGGTAYVGERGIYGLSAGDYVVPHNAVSTSYGGSTFNITVNGGDEAMIRRMFVDEIIPEMTRATADRRTGMGVA